MRVSAVFHGIMALWLGAERADFELPEEAVFADLLGRIGQGYREKMPDQLWNDAGNNFTKGVLATIQTRQIKDPQTPLSDGEEVKFFLMLAGG